MLQVIEEVATQAVPPELRTYPPAVLHPHIPVTAAPPEEQLLATVPV